MTITGSTNQGNVTALGKLWRTEPLEIAKGNVPGYSVMNKFGINPAMGTGGGDVWEFSGTYIFSDTADIDTVSSSDNNDTQTIEIQGLDANWDMVTQSITLAGQTKVTLDTPLIRFFRGFNTNSTNLDGVVYIYVNGDITAGVPDTDADVRGIINGAGGHDQTLTCIYTIPNGYTGYLMKGYVSIANKTAASATFERKARLYGGIFRQQSIVTCNSAGQGSFQYEYPIPAKIPAKTDILTSCHETSATVAVSAVLNILLIKDGY